MTGGGVIMRWGALPTKIRREIFQHTTSLTGPAQTVPPGGRIARLLHIHNGDRTTTTMLHRPVT
jgi:hypothetical protein